MENRIPPSSSGTISRSHSSKRLKFKELPLDDYNQLNSKYELYKRGTPNSYAQDMQALRARNIRNDIATTELPAVQSILNQLAQGQGQTQINQRNYDLYPNLLKQAKPRYKDMLSEKQEIKDFVVWFEGQMQAIDKANDPFARKFENKQTLIAAGFTEMVSQVAKNSKNRAQILKMLWNRENEEVGAVIQALNGQSVKKERTLLEQISKLHHEYQNEIQTLRHSNRDLDQSLSRQKKFNRTLIDNLRILRKRMKKLEYIVKKLSESNAGTKRENLNLIEENIKLLMSIREISEEEAVILNYRRLQVYQEKERLRHHKTKKIIQLANVKEQGLAPLQQLEEKKKALYDFFLERLKQNPDEKVFIREEYFTDEDQNVASIEQHFKNIINRPNIKMELLNEDLPQAQHRERAVNTDPPEETPTTIPTLSLQKGIQVHIETYHSRDDSQGMPERKLYQVMSQREEEQLQKQSKKRMIQHRLSRKNSLTLLQIQGLAELNGGKGYRKPPNLSNFSKKGKGSDSNEQQHNRHFDVIESELQSIQSDADSEGEILAIDKLGKGELMTINVPISLPNQRKSIDFHNLLQRINDSCEKSRSEHMGGHQPNTEQLIHLDNQQQEEIKYGQLQDLIRKHLMKQEENRSVQNPQKYLNKFLLSLYRNVSLTKRYNFLFELLQVIKNSYGNNKSVVWKFLTIVTVIKSHANNNSLLKIISIFLKINEHYAPYSDVNREELPELYFKLFLMLSIRTVSESSFNLWKACTSLEKIRSGEFLSVLDEFFSKKKRVYLESKIEDLVLSAQQGRSRGNPSPSPSTFKKIDTLDDNSQIVKLNPILLYVIQVYLIEKETYHASYKEMLDFASTDSHLQGEFMVWLVDFLGFEELKQNEMLSFLWRGSKGGQAGRSIKNDAFYRFCLRFDLPLFEQLAVAAYSRFKQLPEQLQQRYFRMIGVEEWAGIREELTHSYRKGNHSQIYFKAFLLILDRLEAQIKRGASIYGEEGQQRTKRKEEVFSLFYKIAIIQAHRSHLESDRQNQSRLFKGKV